MHLGLSPVALVIAGGLALGVAFGAISQRSRFCLIAAVSNYALIRDSRQLQAWIAAFAVAMIAAQALEGAGLVALAESGYRRGGLDWVGALAGGLSFGIGGALAGGCAGRTVVNAAAGGVGAMLALMAFAACAWATQFGFLEPLRVRLALATSVQMGDLSAAALLGVPALGVAIALGLTAVGAIFVLRLHGSMVAVGVAVGALVAAGWWVTGIAAEESFGELHPESLTYSGPLARAVALIMGQRLSAAALSGDLRWTLPAKGRWRYYVVGGALMGVGATLAGGCNVGIGLTGSSTLSVNAWLATVSIVVGIRLGLALLERSEPGAD